MTTRSIFSLLCVLLVGACGETAGSGFFHEGGYYASKTDDGKYRVIKILVIDRDAYHVRMFANKFDAPPQESDLPSLTLGGLGSPVGFGVGHLPMSKNGFTEDKYLFIGDREVEESELDGYKTYLKAQ